jgi:hypothetical protein
MKFMSTRKNTALMVLVMAFLSMATNAHPFFHHNLKQDDTTGDASVETYDTTLE